MRLMLSVEQCRKASSHLCTAMYERVVYRGPKKTFEMRADKRMDKSNDKEGFAEQLAFEAGAEDEALAEKNPKHGAKQPLILLWNRYQASTSAITSPHDHTDDTC